jgi:hypothetical protein
MEKRLEDFLCSLMISKFKNKLTRKQDEKADNIIKNGFVINGERIYITPKDSNEWEKYIWARYVRKYHPNYEIYKSGIVVSNDTKEQEYLDLLDTY